MNTSIFVAVAALATLAPASHAQAYIDTFTHPDGTIVPGEGWTEIVITPERGVRTVSGILTGWHEPDASHLQMLEAIAGRDLVDRSYRAALDGGYLWHEFGDLQLILPE